MSTSGNSKERGRGMSEKGKCQPGSDSLVLLAVTCLVRHVGELYSIGTAEQRHLTTIIASRQSKVQNRIIVLTQSASVLNELQKP